MAILELALSALLQTGYVLPPAAPAEQPSALCGDEKKEKPKKPEQPSAL